MMNDKGEMMQAQVQVIDGKYTLISNGKKIAKSTRPEYIEMRAAELGFRIERSTKEQEAKPEFSIRERFEFLTNYVDLVSDKVMPSLIITGDGGLGKTYTVMDTLKKKGLTDVADSISGDEVEEDEDGTVRVFGDYAVIKGFSTARGLYNVLYENKDRIVIFDDCDSVLKDPVAQNLLKGALDSYGDRWISWKSERMLGDGIPSVFKFKGQVIFISNMKLVDINQAVRSRSICVDVSMSKNEKIDRMRQILEGEDFMPTFERAVKMQAVEFIDQMKDKANELSIRTLITVTKLAAKGGTNWKRLAEYTITA